MYDPTIFDNLKVALENQLYDLDTLDEQIEIRNRRDVMDFAVLSRELALRFVLRSHSEVEAEVILRTGIRDLAGEIMEDPNTNPACSLVLRFYKKIAFPSHQCTKIEQALQEIWEEEIEITQKLSYVFGDEEAGLLNVIEVSFIPRLTEENMPDIANFLEHVLETLPIVMDI
ncbi:hypothetical protein DVB69_15995 [Sporosarcina sp. BI001-red]|uniref:hypothetical protein n=1 Tax=Sporosarcina sp. BI001-red TaxID=2282866 RepID=UPI000E263416|nr:hypothetical protein [Sporosarcina sp. BI001-red]REB05254.1 hypothetical protein DVB69_15995 [Sporosarcina sp. BI001-red]